jgi:hypothetical protein
MLTVVKEFYMFVSRSSSHVAHWRYPWGGPIICLLLSSFLLASCSSLSFGGGSASPTARATPPQLPLSKLHWCKKPFILFRDEHAPTKRTPAATATPSTATTPASTATTSAASTPTGSPTPSTLTDWSQVKPLLGFMVYLPSTLPPRSCLVSVSGTVDDPIFGGSFIIGYTLPDKSPISFSEAPSRPNGSDFQCTSMKGATISAPVTNAVTTATPQSSPTQPQILACIGIKGATNIVFSGHGTEASLKQIFDNLKPDVAWVPAA